MAPITINHHSSKIHINDLELAKIFILRFTANLSLNTGKAIIRLENYVDLPVPVCQDDGEKCEVLPMTASQNAVFQKAEALVDSYVDVPPALCPAAVGEQTPSMKCTPFPANCGDFAAQPLRTPVSEQALQHGAPQQAISRRQYDQPKVPEVLSEASVSADHKSAKDPTVATIQSVKVEDRDAETLAAGDPCPRWAKELCDRMSARAADVERSLAPVTKNNVEVLVATADADNPIDLFYESLLRENPSSKVARQHFARKSKRSPVND